MSKERVNENPFDLAISCLTAEKLCSGCPLQQEPDCWGWLRENLLAAIPKKSGKILRENIGYCLNLKSNCEYCSYNHLNYNGTKMKCQAKLAEELKAYKDSVSKAE